MPAPTLSELETAVRAAWSMWTADPADHHNWPTDGGASGQCGSTALVVHDALGGELMMAEVRGADGGHRGLHDFNRLPDGSELDLTREQFRVGERLVDVVAVPVPVDRTRGRLPGQYHLLTARVTRELAAPGAAGGDRPVSVKAVCVDGDGRVLLGRNHRGQWELPGGRPQPGELFAAAVRRELAEETGLAVEVGPLLGVGELEPVPGRWVDIVAFAATATEPSAAPAASDEHLAVGFVEVAALGADELPLLYRELITRAR
jgi:ADP-ribose pyrophosphatase YjhB (NUDIX family)